MLNTDTSAVDTLGSTRLRTAASWRAHPSPRRLSLPVAVLLLALPVMTFADAEAVVAALESRCEADREAKIKPLRDMEIAKCKADRRNDPEFCASYWKDYGNASRAANGTMNPRMFDDLPSCVTAMKARMALINKS